MTYRQRSRRAWRWPLVILAYRRSGLSWRQAWQATHLWVWGYLRLPNVYGTPRAMKDYRKRIMITRKINKSWMDG